MRDWDSFRREQALKAVDRLIHKPDFAPTAFERSYSDEAIDDSKHSGQSILALQKVLIAFEINSAPPGNPDGV